MFIVVRRRASHNSWNERTKMANEMNIMYNAHYTLDWDDVIYYQVDKYVELALSNH